MLFIVSFILYYLNWKLLTGSVPNELSRGLLNISESKI